MFFIEDGERVAYYDTEFQEKIFQFEDDFFKSLDKELEELYLKYSELEVPADKIESVSQNALKQIELFEEANSSSFSNDPDAYFRLQKLRMFVYMNVLNDPVATGNIITELPDDENKLALIENYIEVFSFTDEGAVRDYLEKNKSWIIQLDREFYNELESKIFLSAPIGKNFPNHFSKYKTIQGSQLDLRDKKGKVILIDFWATWCVPCISELPYLIEANNSYGKKGFEIISISLDENRDAFFKFLREWNMGWEQFFDGKGFAGALVREYGIKSLPTTFLLDYDGKVIEKDLQGRELLKILNRLIK